MHAVVAAALSLSPSAADMAEAARELHAPADAPVQTRRSPRMRLALLVTMERLGAIDAHAPDARWFCGWESDVGHARRLVARVAAAPPLEEDWLPPVAWLLEEAGRYEDAAQEWQWRANEYRDREPWEPDRSRHLLGWAMHFEEQAEDYRQVAGLFRSWDGRQWSKPRRVVLLEARAAIGESAWAARRFPGYPE
jgi:hypothetical protein